MITAGFHKVFDKYGIAKSECSVFFEATMRGCMARPMLFKARLKIKRDQGDAQAPLASKRSGDRWTGQRRTPARVVYAYNVNELMTEVFKSDTAYLI